MKCALRPTWADACLATLLASLSACAAPPALRCQSGERQAVEDTLYFGTQTPHGVVTPEEWTRFLGEVVTPRFPHGLTVMDGSGQWQSPAGSPVRESTHILQLVHPAGASDDARLVQIMSEYNSRFAQESVLRVQVNACVTF